MRIMLVDDEQLIVDGLKKIISRQFPDVETRGFTDPVRALDALKADPAFLLVTALQGLSGNPRGQDRDSGDREPFCISDQPGNRASRIHAPGRKRTAPVTPAVESLAFPDG